MTFTSKGVRHMNKIEQTTDYSKFKTIRGNRGINRKYLTRLAESIQEKNLLPQNPIIVSEDMRVIDGQHRLKVAEILSIPIYYTVVDQGTLLDVQRLNSNVRQWTLMDFLDSYIAIGKEDYKTLKDFSDKYGVSLSNSIVLLTGGFYAMKDSKRLDLFRNGYFKANHKEYASTFAKRLTEISNYISDGVRDDREFIKSLDKMYKTGIKHELLMEKLLKSGHIIKRCLGMKEYIRELEDVISWKNKTILRIAKSDPEIATA